MLLELGFVATSFCRGNEWLLSEKTLPEGEQEDKKGILQRILKTDYANPSNEAEGGVFCKKHLWSRSKNIFFLLRAWFAWISEICTTNFGKLTVSFRNPGRN